MATARWSRFVKTPEAARSQALHPRNGGPHGSCDRGIAPRRASDAYAIRHPDLLTTVVLRRALASGFLPAAATWGEHDQYDCPSVPTTVPLSVSIPIVIAVPVAVGAPLTVIWVIPGMSFSPAVGPKLVQLSSCLLCLTAMFAMHVHFMTIVLFCIFHTMLTARTFIG